MDKWVYKAVLIDTEYELTDVNILMGDHPGVQALEKSLNSEGEDGWELVTFLPSKPANKTRKRNGEYEYTDQANPWQHYAIFKKLASAVREEFENRNRA